MKLLLLPLFALSLFRTSGCSKDADVAATAPLTECGAPIKVRNPLPRFTTDNFTVVSVSADGRCLTVTLSATGCSSEGWRLDLWAEGQPGPETGGLLIFDDGVGEDEMTCQAIVEKTYQFDLTPFLGPTPLPVNFSLGGSDVSVEITE